MCVIIGWDQRRSNTIPRLGLTSHRVVPPQPVIASSQRGYHTIPRLGLTSHASDMPHPLQTSYLLTWFISSWWGTLMTRWWDLSRYVVVPPLVWDRTWSECTMQQPKRLDTILFTLFNTAFYIISETEPIRSTLFLKPSNVCVLQLLVCVWMTENTC